MMSQADGPAVHVHLLPGLIAAGTLAGGVAVVVDVLRATTVMAHALAAGCKAIIPCAEIAEAKAVAAGLPAGTAVLAGERHGLPIPGFDLGNSPDDFTAEVCLGKTLVMTTTNGTRAILASQTAEQVGIASFANVVAVSRWAAAAERPVHVVCSGTEGEVSLEDTLLAGEVACRLRRFEGYRLGNDSAVIAHAQFADAARIYKEQDLPWHELFAAGRGGRRLREIGLQKDIEAAGRRECLDVVPVLQREPLRIVAARM